MTVELKGDLWNGVLERAIVREEARTMVRIAGAMEQKVIRFTPVDRGEMKDSYVIGSKVEPTAVTVTLGNRADHALDVAHGTKAHTPDRGEIERYVRRNIDKRKKNLSRRKRWIKRKIREEKAGRKRSRRRTEEDRAQEKERIIEAVTTMTVRAIRRSGTQAQKLGRRAAELGRKIHAQEHRKALRRAIKQATVR